MYIFVKPFETFWSRLHFDYIWIDLFYKAFNT